MSGTRSTDIPCPKCGTSAGNWCIGRYGQVVTNSHRERISEARKAAS